MPLRKFTIGKVAPTVSSTDWGYLITPMYYTASTTKLIVNMHGRGDNAFKAATIAAMRPHLDALVSAGYAVLSLDLVRPNSWGDPDAMRAVDEGVNTYAAGLGFPTTTIGMIGLSMGGQSILNYVKRNSSKVAAAFAFNPVTDLRFFHDTSAQYTPAYTIGGATQAPTGWPAEIDGVYTPSTTVATSGTINGSGGPDSTLTVAAGGCKSFADGNNNAVTGKPGGRVNSADFTYTSHNGNNVFSGVRAVGTLAIVVTASQAVTTTYAQQSLGYKPYEEPAAFRSLSTKVRIVQASDDTTVPPNMNANDANGFVGKVNDANVTLRSPAPTGGHVASLLNIPTSEVVDFFKTNF